MLGRPRDKQNSPLADTPHGTVLQVGAAQNEARGKRAETSRRLMMLDFCLRMCSCPRFIPTQKTPPIAAAFCPSSLPRPFSREAAPFCSPSWQKLQVTSSRGWEILWKTSLSGCFCLVTLSCGSVEAPCLWPLPWAISVRQPAESGLPGALDCSPRTARGGPCPE